MPKAIHKRFGSQGRRRVTYDQWPDGTVSVTVRRLIPGFPTRWGRRTDWAFNAGTMGEARATVANWQRHTGLS